ncbi:MAG: ABC transporter ATP-binding protein [Gammaproteobacteria bacterium]
MSRVPAISLEDVSFAYVPDQWALEHIDLQVEQGEFLGLVGPNGGGKSTLLKLVLGLLEPAAGRVRVLGRDPEAGRAAIGYVPQHAAFARDFPVSVEDAVLLGRLGRTRLLGGYRAADRRIAREAMVEAQILELKDRRLSTLSGGQFQRMLIARALVGEPSILILDEPTANVDQRIETDVFDLFKELNQRMTVVVVSHDLGFISEYVTRVACLNRTLVCHHTADISGEMIEELYATPVRMIEHRH